MKRLLPFLILLVACQKEDLTRPEKSDELHAVTFQLSGFTQHTEPMSVKTKSSRSVSSESDDPYDPSRPCYPDCPGSRYDFDEFSYRELKYFAYDEETGELVGSQTSVYTNDGNEDYGKFTDSLPAGRYDVVFVMCQGEMESYDWENTGPAVFYNSDFNHATIVANNSGEPTEFLMIGVPDIFFKHIKVEVAADVVMDDIVLPRVTGGLEIRLTDETFPDDLDFSYVEFKTSNSYSFKEGAPNMSQALNFDYDPVLTDSGYYKSYYIIPYSETGKVTTDVKIIAASGGTTPDVDTIAYKIIPDVEIEVNKRTILTGKLFDQQNPTQEFTVEVDSSWTEEETVEF